MIATWQFYHIKKIPKHGFPIGIDPLFWHKAIYSHHNLESAKYLLLFEHVHGGQISSHSTRIR